MEFTKLKVNKIVFSISLLLAVFVITTGVLVGNSVFASAQPAPYQPSENILADVDATLKRASESGKLGLIIMGANWCHDSQALAARLNDPALKTLLDTRYETLLVDVGGLEYVDKVIQRFGQPVIYGTPTLLVIDPKGERLVNKDNMYQWRDAEKISLEDTVQYLTEMAATPAPAADITQAQAAQLARIDAFEEEQAKRIYEAFALIGPMVKMHKDERPENFYPLWKELSKFRYQVTQDLTTLRAEVMAETSSELTFPSYKPFSWE